MKIRLDIDSEEDGTIDGVSATHDTGSDIMSIFDIDLARMGNNARLSRLFGGFSVLGCGKQSGTTANAELSSEICRCKFRPRGLAGLTKTRLSG
jgi:hypothetical protein